MSMQPAGILRRSIAARSTAVILVIAGVVGLGFLSLAIPLAKQQESARQQARLNELLDTVGRTVSIACFLADKNLADEVAQGLLSNRTVSQVLIRAGTAALVHRSKDAATDPAEADSAGPDSAELLATRYPPGTLVRKVVSPFNPDETVGEIALIPDDAEIRGNVLRAAWLIALLLIGQGIALALGVVLVVRWLVTRPIAGISARLHALRPEAGEKLDLPRGNEADEIGRLVRDVNVMVDDMARSLGEERDLRLEREIGEKKFRAIFENADTGIFLIDEAGHLLSWNRAYAGFFGMPESAATERPLPLFVDFFGAHRDAALALIGRALAENIPVRQDIKLDGKAGAPTRWVNVVLSPIEDRRLQGVINDITERKRSEEAAQELAATDHLTGLGNRLGFERKLEQMIDFCYRNPEHRFALLMLDLDWLKQVNDTYGHLAGDQVLTGVARTLEKVVRKSDFVGRLGGDEFVLLLDSASRREVIESIIGKIIGGIGQPVSIGAAGPVSIGASIGAALFEGGDMTGTELIRRADQAMYRAKQGGRNTYRFFGEGA